MNPSIPDHEPAAQEPGDIALVSGGSRGLGAELCRQFLAAGYRVATFSRTASPFVEAIAGAPGADQRFFFRPADLTDRVACARVVSEVEQVWGPIRVLINNAGIAGDGLLTELSPEDIDQVIAVNLTGTIQLTRLVVQSMLRLEWGRVINISSITSSAAFRGLTVYGATKAGLEAFGRTLARELGPRGITVNAIAPGYLRTEMSGVLDEDALTRLARRTPVGRLGEPSEVAPLALYLASRQADFITGQTLVIDGGLTC
jgi:3-oxoacyl-[acyl-carrier protein] reductase